MTSKLFPLLIIPAAVVSLVAIPFLQDLDTITAVTSVLRDLPSLGVVAWVVFSLQNRHQDTIQKIMAGVIERENRKDENQKDIIEALLRVIEKPSK